VKLSEDLPKNLSAGQSRGTQVIHTNLDCKHLNSWYNEQANRLYTLQLKIIQIAVGAGNALHCSADILGNSANVVMYGFNFRCFVAVGADAPETPVSCEMCLRDFLGEC
jgi:hypothetical protein